MRSIVASAIWRALTFMERFDAMIGLRVLVAVAICCAPGWAVAQTSPPRGPQTPFSLAQAAAPAPAPPPRHGPIAPVGPMRDAKERREQIERDRLAGVSAYESGDYQTATDYFRRAHQIDPNNDEAMFLLGRAYLAAGAAPSAVIQFDNAIAINGRVEKYYYARAKAKLKTGQYAAAIADFDKNLELRDGKASEIFYLARGDAYLRSNQNDLAIADYNKALEQQGALREAYLHRGIAYARIKDYAHAVQDLNAAEALGRTANALDFDTYYFRGLAEHLMGDKAAASRDYKIAVETYGDDPRNHEARCLAGFLDMPRLGFLGRSIGGCGGVSPARELNRPPA